MLEDQPTFADIVGDLIDLLAGPHTGGAQRRIRLFVSGRRGRAGRSRATDRHRDVHRRTEPTARTRARQPAAGNPGAALGRHADSATRRARRRPGAFPRPEAGAGPRPGARGVAAGPPGDPAPLAQRPGHARGIAAAEDAGGADAVPVSQSGALHRRSSDGAGHAGGAVRRGGAHPRGTRRADPATPALPTARTSTPRRRWSSATRPAPPRARDTPRARSVCPSSPMASSWTTCVT